ncbi:flagellar basal body-associated FliL family protein [Amycolatopsis aidingensis]|uniref:flagellar basal body protein FliL n=1 Tax=Amycolatopsis aidingensis TaxID=2842453 RepID=UPI001E2F935D|nr:flagellar basal body protein FliL [Amycolatopsis aidingensis]
MTNPGQGGPWQPQGMPPGQPQYGQPQYGTPPQGYPQGYQQPYHQQPYGHPQQPYYQQQPPPRKSRRGLVIGLVAALVVALGGGATWFALSQTESVASGAATPTEAARNLAGSLGNGDLVGLLGSLAPAEAALFTDPIEDATGELKRLGVVKPDADPKSLSGMRLQAENLAFDEAAQEQVNDHVAITKLTGGTLEVTANLQDVPLAEDFMDAVLSRSERAELEQGPQTRTIDIAEVVRQQGEPVRIATVNVDGEWYPSLLYTIADYALLAERQAWPQQPVPAIGADSPNEAVQQLVLAALDGDLRRVIELLPPDEMAVLHDVGPVLLNAIGAEAGPSGITVTRLETETSELNGGTRATVTALELTNERKRSTFSLVREGTCYRVSVDENSDRLCADELATMLERRSDVSLPPAARQAVRNLGLGVFEQGIGVVTTEVDGEHYVSPLRTFNELGMTVLRSLQPEDIQGLIRLAE